MSIILEGVVGSTAYGLSTPDSDIDKLGVFMLPIKDVLGLSEPKQTIVHNNPDATYHELKKFINLCLKNNPTVLELLWLDDYTILSDQGVYLIGARDLFLSQNIRNTYGGYARQQSEKLKKRGNFSSDLKKRQAKHGRHCARLLLQGIQLLKTHDVKIKLSDTEISYIFMMGEMAETNIDFFSKEIDRLFYVFDNIESSLPQKPNYEKANNLLLDLRKSYD